MNTKGFIFRALLHTPLGALCGYGCYVVPQVGIPFTVMVVAYEAMQDWRKHDNSYKDVVGVLIGMGIIMVAAGILEHLAVW